MTWRKLKVDHRKGGNGGHLFNNKNNTQILYLGGFDNKQQVKLDTIYELNEEERWTKWDVKLPMPVGNDTVIPFQQSKSITDCEKLSTPLGIYTAY